MASSVSNPGASFKSSLTENGPGPLFEGMEGYGKCSHPDWSIPDNHVYVIVRACNDQGFKEWQNLELPYSRTAKNKRGQMAWIYSLHKDDIPALRSANVSKNLSLEVRSDPPDDALDWNQRPISDIPGWYYEDRPFEMSFQVNSEPIKSDQQPTEPGKVNEPQEAVQSPIVDHNKEKSASKTQGQIDHGSPRKAKKSWFDKDEVKRANPIEEVFREYYPDRPIGNDRKALCPWHNDKETRSLSINFGNSNRFHCHGCGKGGTVIDLVMLATGCQTGEAIQRLGARAGITPKEKKSRYQGPPPEKVGDSWFGEGIVTAIYDYVDKDGKVVIQSWRIEGQEKDKTFSQSPPGKPRAKVDGIAKPLYLLPEVLAAEGEVYLVEGEKDADTLSLLGLCATTNIGGVYGWSSHSKKPESLEPLRDKTVFIIPDNDDAGREGANKRHKTLKGIAKEVKIITLTDLPEENKGGDITDYLNMYGPERTLDDLRRYKAEAHEPSEEELKEQEAAQVECDKKPNKFMKVLGFVKDNMDIRFFKDQYGDSWATIDQNGHFENLNLESKSDSLINLIMKAYVDTQQEGVSLETIKQVVRYLSTSAESKRTLYNRFAGSNDKCLIDMGDDDWNVLLITPDRLEVLDPKPPDPIFARHGHQEPLPIPRGGGDLEEIFDFVPIKDPDIRILFKVWITLLPLGHIQRPLIIILGPPASGKSTITTIGRRIWDPSSICSFALPANQDNFTVAMNNHAIAPIDNLSNLPDWASDDICRAITGAGNIKRKHYSNGEEYSRRYMRTLILNGVSLPKLNSDLLDRSILIHMERRLADSDQIGVTKLEEKFTEAHPRILGAACYALQGAMRIRPTITCKERPRLVDWFEFGCAVTKITGEGEAKFTEAFYNNVESKNFEIMESEPLYQAINSLLLESPSDSYEGSWEELRQELNSVAKRHSIDTSTGWPKAANALSGKMKALGDNLAHAGIKIYSLSVGRDRVKRKRVRISRDF